MPEYSEKVVANTAFYGERAREVVDQEIDRAKSLDTKAGAVIAACVALIGACAALVLGFAKLEGPGSGARALWAVEIGICLVALFVAAGYAVWALAPKVVRSQVHYDEIERWTTPNTLEEDPTLNAGILVNASVHSIGVSRPANKDKSDRLFVSSIAIGAGLAAIVALTISVAVHSAQYPPKTETTEFNGRPKAGPPKRQRGWPGAPGGRFHVPDAGNGHGAAGGVGRGAWREGGRR
jgi:hypothetical protein